MLETVSVLTDYSFWTAIGTIGMCFVSLLNILYTKTEIDYKNKIILTKNLLCSVLRYKKNAILVEIQNRVKILELFICYFLLKKLKKNKTNDGYEFELDYCFNDCVETNDDTKKKIWEVFYLDIHDRDFDYYKARYDKLVELIKIYFGEQYCEREGILNFQKTTLLTLILNDILLGEIASMDSKLPDQTIYGTDLRGLPIFNSIERNLFRSFVAKISYNFNLGKFEAFYSAFRKIYFPINKTYKAKYEDVKNPFFAIKFVVEDIFDIFDKIIQDLIVDYNGKERLLPQYKKIGQFSCTNINDGIVAKISEDLENSGIYSIPNMFLIKKLYYTMKNRYYFNKIKKKYKKAYKNTDDISFSISQKYLLSHPCIGLKIKKKDQKHANNKKK